MMAEETPTLYVCHGDDARFVRTASRNARIPHTGTGGPDSGAYLPNTCQRLVEIASRSHILPGPVDPRANLLINHTAGPGEQQTRLYRARAGKGEHRTESIARRVAARDAVVEHQRARTAEVARRVRRIAVVKRIESGSSGSFHIVALPE
jgi:hypothetical protein